MISITHSQTHSQKGNWEREHAYFIDGGALCIFISFSKASLETFFPKFLHITRNIIRETLWYTLWYSLCMQILGSNPYIMNFPSKTSFGSSILKMTPASVKIILYYLCQWESLRSKPSILMRRKLVLEIGKNEHCLFDAREN